jgi:hypothetical protein
MIKLFVFETDYKAYRLLQIQHFYKIQQMLNAMGAPWNLVPT